jgi:hypothetical protein
MKYKLTHYKNLKYEIGINLKKNIMFKCND